MVFRKLFKTEIPVNTQCKVVLPDETEEVIGSGEYELSCNIE